LRGALLRKDAPLAYGAVKKADDIARSPSGCSRETIRADSSVAIA
jgi:hypothetical protein